MQKASAIPNSFYVYAHKRSDTGAVFYVGKGRHKRAFARSGRNNLWMRIVNKHGFEAIILKDGMEEGAAFDLEAKTIAFYRAVGCKLANMTDGGEGPAGRTFSDETKEKMAGAKRGGKLSPEHIAKIVSANVGKKRGPQALANMRGRTFSDAHRAALSAALTGKKFTPDRVQRMSEFRIGKSFATEESRKKMSFALSAEKNPHHNPTVHKFHHEMHGILECTQCFLRKSYGLPHGNLPKLVSGQRNMVHGWTLVKAKSL